jgi:DNA-binding MltR family transcriptional regulator
VLLFLKKVCRPMGSRGKSSKTKSDLSSLLNLVRDQDESWAIVRDWAVHPGDDRSHAIVAAALLEQALETALLTHFRVDEAEARTLFADQEGSISTFAIKIKLAYALGIIDPMIRTELTHIKNIRNVFAHTRASVTFQTPEIANACNILRLARVDRIAGLLDDLPFFAKDKYAQSIKLIYLYFASGQLPEMQGKRMLFQHSDYYCRVFLKRPPMTAAIGKVLMALSEAPTSPESPQSDDPTDTE